MELSQEVQHALVQRYARLRARLQDEIGEPPVVLPNGDFFPDTFASDQQSLTKLVRRMQKHAGLDDIPVTTQLVGDDAEEKAGGCGTGACGTGTRMPGQNDTPRIVDRGDGWLLNISTAEVTHPVVLTANLARALASIFIAETRNEGEAIDEPVDVTVDLTAVQLGFGVLLLSGSYIYSKSCGGPSVGKVTAMGPTELGFAVGLFLATGGHSFKPVLRELEVTQKDALSQAKEVIDSNKTLLTTLTEAPARLAEGDFKLEAPTPWLLRALGAGKKNKERTLDEMSMDEMEAMLSVSAPAQKKTKSPKKRSDQDDELGALVAEALREAHSDAE
jgi:hypothetical protein